MPLAHILYVEDERALRVLCAGLLSGSGYRVDLAADGEAGWEALQLGQYDLLITDHDMPRLSGLELIQRLRDAGHALPAIVASGGFVARAAANDDSLGIAAVLAKPFTGGDLLATIKSVLHAPIPAWSAAPEFIPAFAGALEEDPPEPRWGINE